MVPKELQDFRNFVYLVWDHLGLPEPTPVQYQICEYLQHGPKRRLIEAFRGVGKSYLTSAYALWRLVLDPEEKILVVSASKQRAQDFSTFTKRLMIEMPLLEHLVPETGDDKRFSNIAFDVAPCAASHSPSVKSIGIQGQITGSRASIIIADDVETVSNSETHGQQEKLSELVKEFDAVIKPGGHIIYLGTPQTEASLYNKMADRGWDRRIWPARYPEPKDIETKYGSNLAPKILLQLDEDPTLINQGTDLDRFSEDDLLERELSYGPTGFALQFQLDTSLSDVNRYPLRLRDLIVMDLDREVCPEKVVWCSSKDKEIKDLPNVGLEGDRYYGPMETVGEWVPYDGVVMSVDPSGRGKDETTWSVVAIKSGMLYLLDTGGVMDGFSPEALRTLSERARDYGANEVICEQNFGGGAFTELLKRALREAGYPVTVTDVHHTKMKEKRILDALEPVWANHRLVVDKTLIERDFESTKGYENGNTYRLFYQASRMQRRKGAVKHDDRIDALSMAVAYWDKAVGMTQDEGIERRRERLLDAELQQFAKNDRLGRLDQEDNHLKWF